MNNRFLISFFLWLFFFSGCMRSDKKATDGDRKISTDVLVDTAGSSVFYIGSQQIDFLLRQYRMGDPFREDVISFYSDRENACAWVDHSGINEYGRNFINLISSDPRISTTNRIYGSSIDSLAELLIPLTVISPENESRFAALEVLLTINFFDYARRNWKGISDEEIRGVGWFIERKSPGYHSMLDSLLKESPKAVMSYEPVFHQYSLLKKQLQRYNTIDNEGGWDSLAMSLETVRRGDRSDVVPTLKRRLYLTGDMMAADTSVLFTAELEYAIVRFQQRHGLPETGFLSARTLDELNVPVHERLIQLLINMERCRWVPAERHGDFLVVNIPAFKLHVFRNDSLAFSSNVIVGETTPAHNTIIFNSLLEHIVFNPYWNIPKNILQSETLPAIRTENRYLEKHDLEVVDQKGLPVPESAVDWNSNVEIFPYIIRQRPGVNNALGQVKFLFPNPYDIYIHDTPNKSLFGETTRTFSHGCIRLEDPFRLVEFLLRNDSEWTKDKVNICLEKGNETFVRLKNKVPVFISYFTAWVDRDGYLNFRDDIYHHDEKMKVLLFPDKIMDAR